MDRLDLARGRFATAVERVRSETAYPLGDPDLAEACAAALDEVVEAGRVLAAEARRQGFVEAYERMGIDPLDAEVQFELAIKR